MALAPAPPVAGAAGASKLSFHTMWPLQLAFALGTVLAIRLWADSSGASHPLVLRTILIVGGLPALALIIGYVSVLNTDARIVADSKASVQQWHKVIDRKNADGYFLTFSFLLICLYILGYYIALRNFAEPKQSEVWPVSWTLATVTGCSIGSLAYFCVRYSAYVRMTRFLENALAAQSVDAELKRQLQGAVFREEQLFEPAGNLFVTIGIAATFLGLAIGLVNLNLRSLLRGSENQELAGNTLGAFVACMGLALGVSMLGVLIAMAAQWLRGHGASEPTEELLARARRGGRRARSRARSTRRDSNAAGAVSSQSRPSQDAAPPQEI